MHVFIDERLCDPMGCCVVSPGGDGGVAWCKQHAASRELTGNLWIWAVGKMTVPGTQITFGRMFRS